MRLYSFFIACFLPLTFGCESSSGVHSRSLTGEELRILDSLHIDSAIAHEIRKQNSSEIEPFHYSLSKMYKDGKESEVDPIRLNGIIFKENYRNADKLVSKLYGNLKTKGYSIFVLERNFGLRGQPDDIAVLKTIDKYEILREIGTNGINFSIDNDSLLKIIKRFDAEFALDLVGASGDWCEFLINKEPADWLTAAKEVYKVCPDVVDQGTATVQALADDMKKTRRLYFWWD